MKASKDGESKQGEENSWIFGALLIHACSPLKRGFVHGGMISLAMIALVVGCSGPQQATTSIDQDTQLYHVHVEQHERDGRCTRREVLFTEYSRLYTRPHLSRVRATDIGCDATGTRDFETFEILRSDQQRRQYENDSSFRSRVDEDLWNAYRETLFRAGEL